MKVLVLANGGKAHAILWKLSQSSAVTGLYTTCNIPALKELAEFVDIREDDTKNLVEFIKTEEIGLTVVESETAIVSGIADILRAEDLPVFGAGVNASKIEKNQNFAKKFFHKFKIPTAHFGTFDKESQAIDHARKAQYPLVVKFDRRSAGSGTMICESFSQAKSAIQYCLNNLYKPIIIEDFLIGRHVTFHVVSDGYNALPLSSAMVYKKSETGNGGHMTEGMGAYAPVNFLDGKLEEKIAHKIFFPLIDGLNAEKITFPGVIKANIIIDDKDEPYLTGVNVSFGDPEAQTILPLLNEDLFAVMYSAAIGAFSDDYELLNLSEESSVCVTLTSAGYPIKFKKGDVIEGLDEIDDDSTLVFHSSTSKNIYGETISNGGRILSVVSVASTIHRARSLAYEAADLIEFDGKKYRKDIAKPRVFEETTSSKK
jgi:phosphoribosylamine--glycine ligase